MSMTVEECAVKREARPDPKTSESVFEQLSMKGKVVAISGAAAGIGLSAAHAVAEAGAKVAVWYNSNKQGADEAVKELLQHYSVEDQKSEKPPVVAYQVDVSDANAVESTLRDVVEHFGHLDVFVANSGTAVSEPLTEQSLEDYQKQMDVNVNGVVYCAKYSGIIFKEQHAKTGRSGNLIITSSMSAHIVNVPVDQPIYNATKAFVTQLGKCLAREWREFARVNIVSPGFFKTKMGASQSCENEAYRMAVLGRQGHVKELKGLYLYLASDASSFQTGSDTLIDGGYTLP